MVLDLHHESGRPLPSLVDIQIHYQISKFLYSPSFASFNLGYLNQYPIVYGGWHGYKYCATVTWLCTFLNIGCLELGLVVVNVVHFLHMEHLSATLFVARRKWHVVLEDRILQLSRLFQLDTEHELRRFAQAQALRSLLFACIPALFTFGVFIRECHWADQRCSPIMGRTIP